MIDTVIFDLDGTLLNTLDDLADSVNYALSQFDFPMRQVSEIRDFGIFATQFYCYIGLRN